MSASSGKTIDSTSSVHNNIAIRRKKKDMSPVQPVRHTTSLAKTVSNNTSATENSSSTACLATDPNYPVTGMYSDIFAHYYIMPVVIGSGRYGNVRECFSRFSGRSFAVKSINKSKLLRLDHLKQEVFNLSKMNHENIMTMVDCYEDASYLHIVTEKYTGGELFQKIIENRSSAGCFSEAKAVRIIRSLLKAVSYLHSNNIVHRDIKPENIVFAYSGEHSDIKLIDFGLSRRLRHGEERMSNRVGTCYYMSPEVLKHEYDNACDVWSVGVVAYILLCGYPPFNGSNDMIQESILKGSLCFSGKGWGDKSNDAKDFISCLLRKDVNRLSAQQALRHPWLSRTDIRMFDVF
jgi:serine/threonine protein kinase